MLEFPKLEKVVKLRGGETIFFRNLCQSDVPSFAEFLGSLSERTLRYWNRHGTTYSDAERICGSVNFEKEISIVSLYGEMIVAYGYLILFPAKWFKKGNCKLGVVVRDEYQNRNIGKELCKHLLEIAKSMKMRKVWLSTYYDNKIAWNLYKKLGFIIEGIFFRDEHWGEEDYRHIVSMALFFDRNEKEIVLNMRKKIYSKIIDNEEKS